MKIESYCLGCGKALRQRAHGRKRLYHSKLCYYLARGRRAVKSSRTPSRCRKCGAEFRQRARPGRVAQHCARCMRKRPRVHSPGPVES